MSASNRPTKKSVRSDAGNRRTWRAEAEKQRRWAWKNACLAANMMNVMEMGGNGDWVGLRKV